MSHARRFDRRSLFDVFRRAANADEPREATPNQARFSLTAFYDRREAAGAAASTFPHVTHREGLATAETTAIGSPDLVKAPARGTPA